MTRTAGCWLTRRGVQDIASSPLSGRHRPIDTNRFHQLNRPVLAAAAFKPQRNAGHVLVLSLPCGAFVGTSLRHPHLISDKNATNNEYDMNKIIAAKLADADCRLCVASVVGVYSPLLLILTAAVVLF